MKSPAFLKAAARQVLSDDLTALSQELRSARLAQETTMVELRDAIRLSGWSLVETMFGGGDTFSRGDMTTIIQQCRVAALKNPLIIRGLALRHAYVFAQGVTISGEEQVQPELERFLQDRRNATQLTGQQGFEHLERERSTTGNVFIACIARSEGRALTTPQVRLLPMEQIRDVVFNPDDSAEPWFYLRSRQRGTASVKSWHPSLELWQSSRQIEIPREPGMVREQGELMWDQPILHRKTRGYVHWPWGVPLVWPALDWAGAHTKFLSSWAAVVDTLGRQAVRIAGKGAGADQIAAAKAKMQSGYVSGGQETNPLPAPGSAFVASDKWDIQAFQARGMAVEVSDSKAFRLQIAAALGVPDHMLGDVDQGNLATATTLDRPTELGFMLDRKWYSELFDTVCTWAVTADRRSSERDEDLITIEWPALLDSNSLEAVKALREALSTQIPAHLGPAAKELTRAILIAAGIDDVGAIMDAAFDDAGEPRMPVEPPLVGPPEAQERFKRTLEAVLASAGMSTAA